MDLLKRGVKKLITISRISQKWLIFINSGDHWEKNYKSGKTSGGGSYNRLAKFKSKILNQFVKDNKINSVVELGCGDGNQLSLAKYPFYLGLDISPTAVSLCSEKFENSDNWRFTQYTPSFFDDFKPFDISLSLDVIFHLVEEKVFNQYMEHLFMLSKKFVIIYSSNTNKNPIIHAPHIRHRKFTDWIEINQKNATLVKIIKQKYPFEGSSKTGSRSDFYIYKKETL